jgi:hypothetical protein
LKEEEDFGGRRRERERWRRWGEDGEKIEDRGRGFVCCEWVLGLG